MLKYVYEIGDTILKVKIWLYNVRYEVGDAMLKYEVGVLC